ncbi:MAG: orotate phosphoribosyltransferase [Ignavibacteria bacterium]|nr:orotate phosphoribosyltransferase [Ignavibacteria bacterium]
MNKQDVLEIFKKADAYLEGHFVLTSGYHSPHYFQKSKVFQYPEFNTALAKGIIEKFKGKKIDVVLSPAVGAIVLGNEVARQLNVRFIFAERENGVMSIRRGFELNEGENVLVVEDIITTGGSVQEVIDMLKKYPVNITGVGYVIDRQSGADFGVEQHALAEVEVIKFSPEEVPDWLNEIPITKPGSRYLKS